MRSLDPPLGASDDVEAPPENPTPRLPKNKAESRFQLNLLDEELGRSTATAAVVEESKLLATQGRTAFDQGDYTEALRLGLKGRRRLGARLETLPPPSPGESGASLAELGASSMGVCGSCGQPLRAADKFCRACGTPRGVAKCAACGEALTPGDRFCGVCGATVRA